MSKGEDKLIETIIISPIETFVFHKINNKKKKGYIVKCFEYEKGIFFEKKQDMFKFINEYLKDVIK